MPCRCTPSAGYSLLMPPDDALAQWIDEVLASIRPGRLRRTLEPLPAEASTRRFLRARLDAPVGVGATTFVAMHAPPASEDSRRFVALARLLRAGGLRAPAIHACDFERGFLLVEDLGEQNFQTAYRQGETDAALEAAIQTLLLLQSLPNGEIPAYTEARLADELGIFAEWLLRNLLATAPPGWFADICQHLVAATQVVPQRPLHRDFHCRNLIWRDDGVVGIVDFQDALTGPVTYDIASLLRDCYHEFDEATVAKWRKRYFDLAGLDVDADVFVHAFDLTALQRQLKAVGIFARLWLRDGRASHLADIAPVLRRIVRLAGNYAQTAVLAEWIDAEVLPKATRRLAGLP